MTTIMRRTVRGTAAGLGALAIVAGTAACGGILGGGDDEGDTGTGETQEDGGSSESEGEDTGTEQDSSDTEDTGDTGDTGSGEDGGDAADDSAEGGTDSDDATGSGDGTDSEDGADDAGDSSEDGDDAAAGGGALAEDDLTAVGDTYYEFLEAAASADGEAACALITNPETDKPLEGAEVAACAAGFEGEAEEAPVDPEMMDAIDRSMVEAVDNGDGTAGVTLMGQDAGVTFVSVDGSWYIDGSQVI